MKIIATKSYHAQKVAGYTVLPPMDEKYKERPGLEGPYPTRSGKVVYYDPREGKYYDPSSDMYIDNEEAMYLFERRDMSPSPQQ
jgi:hypothetical protein